MRSIDGKSIIGPIESIKKINTVDDTKITEIDIKQIEIEKKVSIDMSVFFGQAIHRLAAQIAFEWYCLNNSATLEQKKMIACHLFKHIEIGRDYEISVELNMTYQQFCFEWSDGNFLIMTAAM